MVELAIRMASSSPEKVSIDSTGPKISSRAIDISGVTPENTVGWKNLPVTPGSRPPPVSSSAPARPSATYRSIVSSCSWLTIAPTLVASSSGSPTGTRRLRSTTAAWNSSAMERSTITRLPLLQHSPALK